MSDQPIRLLSALLTTPLSPKAVELSSLSDWSVPRGLVLQHQLRCACRERGGREKKTGWDVCARPNKNRNEFKKKTFANQWVGLCPPSQPLSIIDLPNTYIKSFGGILPETICSESSNSHLNDCFMMRDGTGTPRYIYCTEYFWVFFHLC